MNNATIEVFVGRVSRFAVKLWQIEIVWDVWDLVERPVLEVEFGYALLQIRELFCIQNLKI